MLKRTMLIIIALFVLLLSGCGEKKSEFQLEREKSGKDAAQRLSSARKNNNIDEALQILLEPDYITATGPVIRRKYDGFELAVSESFSSWIFSSMEKVEPSFDVGYYDDISKRKESITNSSDGYQGGVEYDYFGDFEVEKSWSYDTIVKMYTRNIYYKFSFRGVLFLKDNWESNIWSLEALKYRLDKHKPSFYVHNDYFVYKEYGDGSSFILYDNEGGNVEVNTPNPYRNRGDYKYNTIIVD